MTKAFARLHVLLAREAPVGLVVRHGTAKSVCTMLWDRRRDTFTLGQWLRGRIDPATCDLSPDGAHFLYSADKSHPDGPYGYSVVSKMPYLKALGFYRLKWGGGWFLNNRDFCMPYGLASEGNDREHPSINRVIAEVPEPSLYAARLARSGWTIKDSRHEFNGKLEFVREAGHGWLLRHKDGGYLLSCGEVEAETDGWDWADVDGKRIVWTVRGCLWAGVTATAGLENVRLLHDFNGNQFEAIQAPYEEGERVRPKTVTLVPSPEPVSPKRPKVGKLPKKPNRGRVRPALGLEEGDE